MQLYFHRESVQRAVWHGSCRTVKSPNCHVKPGKAVTCFFGAQFSSFYLSCRAAGKEVILLNDKIVNRILRQKRDRGSETRGGKVWGEYISELANVPSCQGVNLSEAVHCDILYSELPNLSALIFQLEHCLSYCARDDWSIKTTAGNLLNIYVQCHAQECSVLYSTVLCSYIQDFFQKSNLILSENVTCKTAPIMCFVHAKVSHMAFIAN